MIEYDDRVQIPYVPVAVKPQWAEMHRRPGAACEFRWLAGPEHGRTNQSPAGCAILSVGNTGSTGGETARVHNVARWCCGVADCGARAAGGDASGWLPRHFITRHLWLSGRRIPPRPEGKRLRRGTERRDRISLGGQSN